MPSGALAMDYVFLVAAAADRPMPQSREHQPML